MRLAAAIFGMHTDILTRRATLSGLRKIAVAGLPLALFIRWELGQSTIGPSFLVRLPGSDLL